jgi:hypothetical protein
MKRLEKKGVFIPGGNSGKEKAAALPFLFVKPLQSSLIHGT